jgi:hypothetical protein
MEGFFATMMRESAERLVAFRQARLEEFRKAQDELYQAGRDRRGAVRAAAARCHRFLAETRRSLGRIHADNRRMAREEDERRRIFAGDLRSRTRNLLDMFRLPARRRRERLGALADDVRRGLDIARRIRCGQQISAAHAAQPGKENAAGTGSARARSGGNKGRR